VNIRVPKRVVEYMLDTGWGQEHEPVTDPSRVRLLQEFRNRDARGGLMLRDVTRPLLARLYFEAEHTKGSWLYGDHDPDTYADFRAALKLQEAIRALDPTVTYDTETMYG
jgi:hypothetical protein